MPSRDEVDIAVTGTEGQNYDSCYSMVYSM